MDGLLFGIIIAIILAFIYTPYKNHYKNHSNNEPKSKKAENNIKTEANRENNTKQEIDYKSSYQKKWMFTYNEKNFYRQISRITSQNNLELFAKVRLFDLVEPIKNNPKYKTCLYKIQGKHVDFVVCDQKLVARYIIELDDGSHNSPERQERDNFVDNVLIATGYKVLRIRAFDEIVIKNFLGIQHTSDQTSPNPDVHA